MGNFFSRPEPGGSTPSKTDLAAQNTVLHRDLSVVPPSAASTSDGNEIALSLGHNVWDGSGGAAVSCFGHAFQSRIWTAVAKSVDYAATTTFTSDPVGTLCHKLVKSTNGLMSRVVLYTSGKHRRP